jgi:hypothetical protein
MSCQNLQERRLGSVAIAGWHRCRISCKRGTILRAGGLLAWFAEDRMLMQPFIILNENFVESFWLIRTRPHL